LKVTLIEFLIFFRVLHTAREKRANEKDGVDYIFIKQDKYEEDVTKVCQYYL
jgi:guanylate kinase